MTISSWRRSRKVRTEGHQRHGASAPRPNLVVVDPLVPRVGPAVVMDEVAFAVALEDRPRGPAGPLLVDVDLGADGKVAADRKTRAQAIGWDPLVPRVGPAVVVDEIPCALHFEDRRLAPLAALFLGFHLLAHDVVAGRGGSA